MFPFPCLPRGPHHRHHLAISRFQLSCKFVIEYAFQFKSKTFHCYSKPNFMINFCWTQSTVASVVSCLPLFWFFMRADSTFHGGTIFVLLFSLQQQHTWRGKSINIFNKIEFLSVWARRAPLESTISCRLMWNLGRGMMFFCEWWTECALQDLRRSRKHSLELNAVCEAFKGFPNYKSL